MRYANITSIPSSYIVAFFSSLGDASPPGELASPPGENARGVTEPKQYQMQKRATKHLNFAARCMKRRGRLL